MLNKLNSEAREKSKDVLTMIHAVIDDQSFVESDTLIRSDTVLGEAVGEGVVSGFAYIDDIRVGIFAVNPAVLKGGIGSRNAAKIAKCIDNAVKTGAPVVGIVDTQGARFAEGLGALEGYGKILKSWAEAYGEVPTVLVNKGFNFGPLAYLTAYSDFTVSYDKAVMATSSPLILASSTKIDTAKVGTNAVHTANGNVSFTVKNDKELKSLLTSLLGFVTSPSVTAKDDPNRVCKGLKAGTAATAVIAEAFDKGSFVETKSAFAKEIVTGFARLNGIACGVVANNGAAGGGMLTDSAAIKIVDLLTTCENFGLPVVNLVDCAGVARCLDLENNGLIREVGNLVFSYNRLSVPRVAVITGKAVGLGYTALASKSVCDYTVAWDSAYVGVTDSLAAAELMYSAEIAKAKNKDKAAKELAASYAEENCSAAAVSKDGYIDNIIEPNLTRQYLIAAVQAYLGR